MGSKMTKEVEIDKNRESWMQLCLHLDGKDDVYLRVPTVWNDISKKWTGFIKTPETKRLIHGEGATSFDLQNSFNVCLDSLCKESKELADEILGMFMPAFYWED